MATKGTGVGAQLVTWGINGIGTSSAGIVEGTNGALANGASSEMGQLVGVEKINLPLSKMRAVPIPGDNGLIAAIPLPPNTVSQGDLTLTVEDPVFSTAPIGMLVDTEDTLDLALLGVPCPTFKSLTMINNSPGQNATSGSLGVPGYLVSIYPNIYIYPRGNDNATDGNALNFMSDLMASMFDRYPWGQKPTVVLNGSTRGARMNPFFSIVPWNISTIVGDGALTTQVLNNTPYAANGTYVRVFDNNAGTCTPLVYGSGAGKYQVLSGSTITYGTALTTGHVYTAFYGYIPSC